VRDFLFVVTYEGQPVRVSSPDTKRRDNKKREVLEHVPQNDGTAMELLSNPINQAIPWYMIDQSWLFYVVDVAARHIKCLLPIAERQG
jgi:hypothetical protein